MVGLGCSWNDAGLLPVDAEDVEDLLLAEVEAEGFHGDFELVVVDVSVLVEVEELELRGGVEG